MLVCRTTWFTVHKRWNKLTPHTHTFLNPTGLNVNCPPWAGAQLALLVTTPLIEQVPCDHVSCWAPEWLSSWCVQKWPLSIKLTSFFLNPNLLSSHWAGQQVGICPMEALPFESPFHFLFINRHSFLLNLGLYLIFFGMRPCTWKSLLGWLWWLSDKTAICVINYMHTHTKQQ